MAIVIEKRTKVMLGAGVLVLAGAAGWFFFLRDDGSPAPQAKAAPPVAKAPAPVAKAPEAPKPTPEAPKVAAAPVVETSKAAEPAPVAQKVADAAPKADAKSTPAEAQKPS